MVSDFEMEKFEEIIVQNAGPMGKFVIKKSMSDLGLEAASLTGPSQAKLVDMVLQRAIFDEAKRPVLKKEILAAWGGLDG